MGLPTTANYLVVAALMANVVVEVGNASGYIFPLIAIHLFVFYYGLMADVTPPVGLASYAASAISRADPIKTGVQAFWYSLRTGILPIVFIFNNELLLIGIESWIHAIIVMITSLSAILIFTSASQGWFIKKLKWYEIIIFLIISMSLFRPDYIMNQFYPKYEYQNLSTENLNKLNIDPKKNLQIKVTRETAYGPRYKLFEFKKNSIKNNYNLNELGIKTTSQKDLTIIDNIQWNSPAKKAGLQSGDIINEIKIENLKRPKKEIVYPISIVIFLILSFLHYRRKDT